MMLSSKVIIRFLRQSNCVSRISLQPVIPQNFTRNVHLLKLNSCTSICETNIRTLLFYRNYAKGKDKKKDKVKTKVTVNEAVLAEVLNVESVKTQMQTAVDQLKEDFIKNVSLRSSAGSLEMLTVEFDGNEHTLQELSQITRKNPKTIVINMSVFPQAIPSVLKAIEKSGMNLNPQQDGTTLYIPIPNVTKEHREQLAKGAKQYFIKCRDTIKDTQMKNVKKIKKKDGVSEDLAKSVEAQLAAIAEEFISQANKILESKQNELIGKE